MDSAGRSLSAISRWIIFPSAAATASYCFAGGVFASAARTGAAPRHSMRTQEEIVKTRRMGRLLQERAESVERVLYPRRTSETNDFGERETSTTLFPFRGYS